MGNQKYKMLKIIQNIIFSTIIPDFSQVVKPKDIYARRYLKLTVNFNRQIAKFNRQI